ncbi:DUF6150 family protein [Pontibacter silvestris]|uniref:DUF6150 family protein n=1 Tax=Pontibacter silvestris TaxID=2305183 RepID=A0ABW4WXA5_9BACT|nr:DUF6150 family protein [Pontibacter silvestris]MCC9136475.1 DUF6150 family protein [Pontibacter silvestris]
MSIIFSLLLALAPFFSTLNSNNASASEPVVVEKGFCRIYGAVYLERDPKYRNTAAYTVFLNDDEAFANMIVYKEKNKLFADNTAIWYLTPKKAFADHILYVTDKRNLADFTVHFTDVRSYATCRE